MPQALLLILLWVGTTKSEVSCVLMLSFFRNKSLYGNEESQSVLQVYIMLKKWPYNGICSFIPLDLVFLTLDCKKFIL